MRWHLVIAALSVGSALGCAQIFGFEPGTLGGSGGAASAAAATSGSGAGTTTTNGSGGGEVTPTGETVWSRSFGDGWDQMGGGVAVFGESVFVVGDFWGTIDFGDGPLQNSGDLNIYLARLAAADGATEWSNDYGDDNDQRAREIGMTRGGNIVLSAGFSGTLDFGVPLSSNGDVDVYVAELDPAGGHVHSDNFGSGPDQWANGMAVSSSGAIAVAGGFEGIVDFGGDTLFSQGNLDVFVAVFDAQHQLRWSHGFGAGVAMETRHDEAMAVAFDGQDNVIVTGYFTGDVEIDDVQLEHSDGADVFVAKFNPDGELLWAKAYGDGDAVSFGLAVGPDDAIYVAGGFDGNLDFGGGALQGFGWDAFVGVLDPDGGFIWQWSGGSYTDNDFAESVAVDAQGNLVVAGCFEESIDVGGMEPLAGSPGNRDLFIAKLDPSFALLWSRVWGDGSGEANQADDESSSTDLAIAPDGSIYISTSMQGTIDTGASVHESAGGRDLLVAKLKP